MQKSSNDITSGQSFTVKVTKLPTGEFEAICKNNPKLRATSKTQTGAMAKANDLINKHIVGAYDEGGA